MRAMVFANRAMANRSNLEREATNWINAEGTTLPGNGAPPGEKAAAAGQMSLNRPAHSNFPGQASASPFTSRFEKAGPSRIVQLSSVPSEPEMSGL